MIENREETVFSLLSIIYFLGILQGILLFFSLFFRKKNFPANKGLSILVLLMAVILLNGYIDRISLFIAYPHLLLVTFPLPFLCGPIIYVYVGLLTKTVQGLRKKDVVHLLPFAAVTAYLFPFYVKHDYQKFFAMITMQKILSLLTLTMIVCGIIYSVFAYFLLRRYQRALDEYFSETGRINLNWLRILLPAVFLLWGVFLLEFIVSREVRLTYIGVTFLIYIIGYFSMRQPEIRGFRYPQAPESRAVPGEKKSGSMKNRYENDATPEKWQALLNYMDKEKPFLEPSISLAELAERLSFSPHFLSYLINTRSGKNFFQFINGFRVEELKKALSDPLRGRKDLFSMALDAGFSTKATFNSIFKQTTGMTPSQYRDSCG